ncbi:hypothetical protein, partial [Salmonella enterica]|uniref:hypothetical protein n=1 Tax=Salmonella enterica TaxID=28901 RepID=UPI003297878E
LNAMTSRFNNKKGSLSFDDFLQIVCRIYSLKDNFDRYADRRDSQVFVGRIPSCLCYSVNYMMTTK